MPVILYTPITLKLYAYGLRKLNDHNWAGTDMYYYISDCHKKRDKPFDLLKTTLKNGLLYKLGEWLYDEYFNPEWKDSTIQCHINELRNEDKLWYLENIYEMLIKHGINAQETILIQLKKTLDEYNQLYESNEDAYFKKLTKENRNLNQIYSKIYYNFKNKFNKLKSLYAENFGERAFHDRQLCEYISQLLVISGICEYNDCENPISWIERKRWPTWVKPALLKRENNQCAICSNDFGHFSSTPVIDHIVPLARGGTNDLVNLQILCKSCNQKKYTHSIDTTSSIPPYFQRYLDKKSK